MNEPDALIVSNKPIRSVLIVIGFFSTLTESLP